MSESTRTETTTITVDDCPVCCGHGPCNGNGCCCASDCCAEDITCLTVSIPGAPPFNITGGPLCSHAPLVGTMTCGPECTPSEFCPCQATLIVRCDEGGGIFIDTIFPIGCSYQKPEVDGIPGNYECQGCEQAAALLPFDCESNYYGTFPYSCCPFYIPPEAEMDLAGFYECTCLKGGPVVSTVRNATAVRCPPEEGMMAVAPERQAKELTAAKKRVERTGPLPHPCRKGPGKTPCGNARQGPFYTMDQCHFCWFFENDQAYRTLWGGGIHPDRIRTIIEHAAPDVARLMVPKPKRGYPGKEITAIIAEIGKDAKLDLSTFCTACKLRAGQMDTWGVEGCKVHRDEIISWIKEAMEAIGFMDQLAAAAVIWRHRDKFPNINWLMPTPSSVVAAIVDEAIRRAEAKERA